VAKKIPWLLGGSADLAPSTKTLLTFEGSGGALEAFNPGGRNMHFGIREHAMMATVNGMVLTGLRAFGATFFVFADYCRPSLRLAAIMKIPSIAVFTHDSIGVGEDGPTHQPIEQLAACRAIPNYVVIRPGDANETVQAWRAALQQTQRPVALALTRQNVATIDRAKYASAEGVLRGGYVLGDAAGGKPDVILIATGSELALAVAAHEELTAVTARVGVEAGIRQGWDKYLGQRGAFVGLDTFGASAPFEEIYKHRGLTVAAIVAKAKELVSR
jgi:transketolase